MNEHVVRLQLSYPDIKSKLNNLLEKLKKDNVVVDAILFDVHCLADITISGVLHKITGIPRYDINTYTPKTNEKRVLIIKAEMFCKDRNLNSLENHFSRLILSNIVTFIGTLFYKDQEYGGIYPDYVVDEVPKDKIFNIIFPYALDEFLIY